MWERGDLVWVSVSYPDKWLPGVVLGTDYPEIGILVSFFHLRNPRYFLARQLCSFEPNFKTLISNSPLSHDRVVNRALRSLFRTISDGLSCPCTRPVGQKHYRRLFPSRTELALRFVRNAAVSPSVHLEGLAEAISCSAQVLSFRRYAIDFDRSKAIYEEIEESAHSLHGGDSFDVNPRNLMDLLLASSLHEMLNSLRCLAVHPMHFESAGLDTVNTKSSLVLRQGISYFFSKEQPIVDSARSDTFLKACKTVASSMNGVNVYPSKGGARCEPGASDALLPSAEFKSAPTYSHAATEQNEIHISNGDYVMPIKMKRKTNDNVSSGNSLKKNKVAHDGTFYANPRSLLMKFLKNHNLPSKGDLLKKFSSFGKIDSLRTEVYACTGSAQVVFKEHIDAVAAYQYAKSHKVAFGQSNVLYWLGYNKQNEEETKDSVALRSEEPALKSCMKASCSGKKDGKRKRVRFRIEIDGRR